MLIKSCPVSVKTADTETGLSDGQFTALVSVFGNKDSYGDVVLPGAFEDTLAEWKASGDPIPVYYSHRMDDPDYNIGWVLDAKETDEGLWVKAQLDTDTGKAAQVHRLLKGRRITQFSFAYDVLDAGWAERDGEDVYELRKLKLFEVGPTPIGANQQTELLAVKSAAERAAREVSSLKEAGREIAPETEKALRSAHELLGGIVASFDASEKANTNGPAKSNEDPEEGKSDEEPSRGVPVDHVAALIAIAENGVTP